MASEFDVSGDGSGRKIRREVVDEASMGVRTDHFLSERLAISRAETRRLLAHGRVRRDGRPLKLAVKGDPVVAGWVFEVEGFQAATDCEILPEPDSRAVVRVLAQAEGWLAVDKAAGAPVHPLVEAERGTVLNQIVSSHPEVQGVGEAGLRSGVVHRLDVDTSGVLLVATQQESWQRLRTAFREHQVEKVYRAIVLGGYRGPSHVELGLQVARHRPARVRVVGAESGSTQKGVWIARQKIEMIEELRGASLVEVRPETGFLHQIRATLAHLGHPLAGDRVYLDGRRDPSGADRQQLHAAGIRFEEVAATSPDPPDLLATLDRLR